MKNRNIKITSAIVLSLLIAGFMFHALGFLGTANSGVQPRVVPQAPVPLNLSVHLQADGASFPLLLIQQYISNYQATHPNVTITYTSTGSGKGQRDFINKTMDFAASDAPLNAGQRVLAPNSLHIPETIGSVTAAYNLPGNATGVVNLDGPTIANIYLGSITMWNDPAIQALNPGLKLPAQAIKVAYRSDSSGTTFVWTSYLSQVSNTWKTTAGLGPATGGTGYPWPTGTGAALNQGVANYVNATPYALGYVELAYVITHSLTVANIKNPAGNFIFPTETTTANAVADGAGSLPSGSGDWSAVSLLNEPGTSDYPIASFTYFLVYQELNVVPSMDLVDGVQAATLKDFLSYCVSATGGQTLGGALGFVPLPSSVIANSQASINSITFTHIGKPVTRTVNLSVGSTGWSIPSLTVTSGDTINFNFLSTDSLNHQWYIDFNNNGVMDPEESWSTQASPIFNSPTVATAWTFNPVIWFQEGIPAAGTYTFRDSQNAALTGTIVVQPQQTAARLLPNSALNSKLAPVLDTSRVSTIGSVILDQRNKNATGFVAAVSVDKTSGAITSQKTYTIPGLKLVRSSTVPTDLTVSFILNLAVLNNTVSQPLSTDVTVTLHDNYVADTSTLLTRELDMASQGTVNVIDLATVAIHFGSSVGQPNYLPSADVDSNGVINVIDLATVAIYFGDRALS